MPGSEDLRAMSFMVTYDLERKSYHWYMFLDMTILWHACVSSKVCFHSLCVCRYTLGGNFPKVTDQDVAENGYNTNKDLCTGFDNTGITRGFPGVFHHHLDYDSVFVGHYSAGDLQHKGHYSSGNNNLIYWKESKAMEDGCSAHLSGGHYEYGNMALPDQATFIIEDTR